MKKGHPIRGAISGLFFGIGLDILLLTFGVLALDSIVLVIVPILFLVLGIVMGVAAPFKRDRLQPSAPAAPPA